MKTALRVAAAIGIVIAVETPVHDQASLRTHTFQLSEVTQPDVAAAPDGKSIVFTGVGHLFRVPAAGGTATQLTSGASYNNDPVFSPDGTRIAFVSDRDGSGGNIFVLDFATKRVAQVTREWQAELPIWSPDGATIAYVRVRPNEEPAPRVVLGSAPGTREVRTAPARGGAPTVIGTPQYVGSLFYLPDGRLGWTAPERSGGGMFATTKQTRLETRAPDGSVQILATIPGDASRVLPSPEGDGLMFVSAGNVRLVPWSWAAPSTVITLGGGAGRFSVAPNGDTVFFSRGAQLLRAALTGGTPEALKLTIPVSLQARPAAVPKWKPPSTAALKPQAVVGPQISPDGKRFVYMAAGFLWEQSPGDGKPDTVPARRLLQGNAFERDPSFSPDGSKLAFVASEAGKRELKVYDFATRQTRTLYSVGGASWPLFPSWKPDGSAVLVQRSDMIGQPYRLINVTLADGKVEELGQTRNDWAARPHYASDRRSIFYTSRETPQGIAGLYRLALTPGAKPEPLTKLTRHVHEGLVSPDGRWLAFRRNSEIWVAPMTGKTITDDDIHRLSAEGGRSFSFTSDSRSIVYSGGGRVFVQAVGDLSGERTELSVRLTLPRAIAPPTLVRRVRLVDVQAGRVGEETSLLLENGRIQQIGTSLEAPAGATVVDGGGRIAIPGLFDLHIHSGWANQQASEDIFPAFGITSLRDPGGTLDTLAALDDRSETTALPMPRYFFSGEIFEGSMPQWGDAFLQIATETEAREHVRRWKDWGVDFIKVYPSLPLALQRVVVDEAHRLELPLAGHGIGADEIIRRTVQGYASLEHSPAALNDDLIEILAATGTRLDATLTIWGGHILLMRDHPERLMAPRVQTFVAQEIITSAPTGGLMGRQSSEMIRPSWKDRLARVKEAQRRGVRFRAGTDSLMSGTLFGLSTHWELEHFVEAGFTPAEALRMATLEAAETVGAAEYLGTLDRGKFADIVLLDANPLEDIRNTQAIWRVIKAGHVIDPATIRTSK